MRSTPMAAAKTERLLNLVIALLSTRRALSKAAIRDRVAPYREAPSVEAFERMFERDKDELREMGIPLVTEDLDDFFEDEPGYRIDRGEYSLPDLSMTPEQLSLLSLAGRTWSQAALGGAAVRALRKLESVAGDGLDEPDVHADGGLDRIEAGVRTSEPAFEAARAAVVATRPVRFDYRRPRGEPGSRHVQPWGIAGWHGHWYLTGHDVDRGEPRVFRLDRIVGEVTPAGAPGSYDIPEDHDPGAVVASSLSGGEPVQARLRLRPDRGHGLRRRATTDPAAVGEKAAAGEMAATGETGEQGGWDVVEVVGTDLQSFADEIVGYGADVVVEGPPALRDAVITRLRAVLAVHGDLR